MVGFSRKASCRYSFDAKNEIIALYAFFSMNGTRSTCRCFFFARAEKQEKARAKDAQKKRRLSPSRPPLRFLPARFSHYRLRWRSGGPVVFAGGLVFRRCAVGPLLSLCWAFSSVLSVRRCSAGRFWVRCSSPAAAVAFCSLASELPWSGVWVCPRARGSVVLLSPWPSCWGGVARG